MLESQEAELDGKVKLFKEETKTKKTIFLTMITTLGTKKIYIMHRSRFEGSYSRGSVSLITNNVILVLGAARSWDKKTEDICTRSWFL